MCRTGAKATQMDQHKVLIVDDDDQVRASLTKALRAEGYQVVSAADAQEARDAFVAEGPALLLLDLNLPTRNGWDVFEQLTSLDPFVPVVVITGRRDQRELAEAAGVGALFEKPLDVGRLLETIRTLLAEPAEAHLQRLVGLRTFVRHARHRRG